MSEYTEPLGFHGTLRVTRNSWEIEYYFPGPDRRYNGEFKRIPGTSIDSWIDAYRRAWQEYEQLRVAMNPTGGEFSKMGPNGLTICVGGSRPGVSYHYRLVLSTKDEVERLVASFEHAKRKATEVQGLFEK